LVADLSSAVSRLGLILGKVEGTLDWDEWFRWWWWWWVRLVVVVVVGYPRVFLGQTPGLVVMAAEVVAAAIVGQGFSSTPARLRGAGSYTKCDDPGRISRIGGIRRHHARR
jgi:hypothetical protein